MENDRHFEEVRPERNCDSSNMRRFLNPAPGGSKTPAAASGSGNARFSPPLSPKDRYAAEVDLAKKLEAGREVIGGIVFSISEKRFIYYPNHGYIDPPLVRQCAALRLPLPQLGKIRHDKFNLQRSHDEPAVPMYLFARVLKGSY